MPRKSFPASILIFKGAMSKPAPINKQAAGVIGRARNVIGDEPPRPKGATYQCPKCRAWMAKISIKTHRRRCILQPKAT